MSLHKQKVYPITNPIKLNLTLTNNLDFDGKIENISITPTNPNIQITSSLQGVLNSLPDINFIINKKSEFVIPLKVLFREQYSGFIGKILIEWSDSRLKTFTTELNNNTIISLPEIHAKEFEVNLNYSIPKAPHTKEEIFFDIYIKNNSEDFKKILFLVDTSTNFVCSGSVKKKLVLYPSESKLMRLPLVPIYYGKLKLPPFKIMEFPLMGNSNYENKIYSIYYIPESISISQNMSG